MLFLIACFSHLAREVNVILSFFWNILRVSLKILAYEIYTKSYARP